MKGSRKSGDARRRKKGGRYTPPMRQRGSEQPVRMQLAVNKALSANTQAPTPVAGSSEIPPIEQLPEDDQILLRGLSAKVRKAESPTQEGSNPKEDAFYEAVAELNDCILDLRAMLDAGFEEPHHSDTSSTWAKAEPRRPSVKRVQHLAYNFLDLPGIRRTSNGIHGRKIVAALPYFRGLMADSVPSSATLSGYFAEVTTLMADSLVASLDPAMLQRYRNVGLLMGYRTAGMRWPIDAALRHFAGQGVGTFVEQVERVVRGALEDGVDPSARVIAELMDNEGTIHRLMRISFDRVNDAVKDIEGRSLDDARKVLAANDYSTGGCPALVSVDDVVEGDARARRPIAYEYATTILRYLPHRLLEPSSHRGIESS